MFVTFFQEWPYFFNFPEDDCVEIRLSHVQFVISWLCFHGLFVSAAFKMLNNIKFAGIDGPKSYSGCTFISELINKLQINGWTDLKMLSASCRPLKCWLIDMRQKPRNEIKSIFLSHKIARRRIPFPEKNKGCEINLK